MENTKKERPSRWQAGALVTVLLVLVVILCLVVTIQVVGQGYANVFGFSMFRVVTGSMEPAIPVGSLLITREVDMQNVQIGDIICFQAQESAIFGRMMTHRVVEIYPAPDGGVQFVTKGDANLALDGYLVTQTNFVGKVIWHTREGSTLAGIFSVFTSKIGFMACIVFPCLLIGSLVLKDCVKSIRTDMEEALKALEETPDKTPEPSDPLLEMTDEERNEMYERIRAELIEELIEGVEEPENPEEQ